MNISYVLYKFVHSEELFSTMLAFVIRSIIFKLKWFRFETFEDLSFCKFWLKISKSIFSFKYCLYLPFIIINQFLSNIFTVIC